MEFLARGTPRDDAFEEGLVVVRHDELVTDIAKILAGGGLVRVGVEVMLRHGGLRGDDPGLRRERRTGRRMHNFHHNLVTGNDPTSKSVLF